MPTATTYTWWVIFVIALGPLLFGFHLAELNAIETALRCQDGNQPVVSHGFPSCFPMEPSVYGFVSSIFALGGLAGALVAGPLMSKSGRRFTLIMAAIIYTTASLLMFVAVSPVYLGIGRMISGVASGMAVVAAPLFIEEVAPPNTKGFFGASTQVSINLGILLTQSVGIVFGKPNVWRMVFLIGIAIAISQIIFLLSTPESPKVLFNRGQVDQARRVLQQLRGFEDVVAELKTYDTSEDHGHATPSASADPEDAPLLSLGAKKEPKHLTILQFLTTDPKTFSVVTGIMVAQQALGINAIMMYGVLLLRKMLPESASRINAGISFVNLFVTLAASLLFDRMDHKYLLIASMLGMTASAFAMAYAVASQMAVLMAAVMFLFVISFSFGLGPLPWMVAGSRVKFEAVDAAQSAGLAANWIGTYIISLLVPIVEEKWGLETLFLGFAMVGCAFSVWAGVAL
ncbi:Bifunctional purine biosynthesis protein PurH [Rhizina undulata]